LEEEKMRKTRNSIFGICKDQAGKLSLEAVGWMVLALLLVALGGAAGFSIMSNKTDGTQKLLTQKSLVCPANSVALDVRQYIPAGVPLTGTAPNQTVAAGIAVGAYTTIATSSFTDANSDKTTAEFVCVASVAGY
jgi:hypothetical protein